MSRQQTLSKAEATDKTDTKTLKGHPVQIVKINEDEDNHSFVLDEVALGKILEDGRIRDKPVCVVSVAGAFRKGKSFLLDFMLRYLTNECSDLWLGDSTNDDNRPLDGFHWRGGADRDTTGILAWSEVFIIRTKNKDAKGDKAEREVAVLLLDTQGAFDCSSTVRDCATIFALSAMVSSVLIYNLSSNIQEDDLQHLQLFTEYGRLALEDSGETPFQKLQFLVRDWSSPYEYEYGAGGGMSLLKRRLEVSEKQHPELQSLRKHINSCFAKIEAFLMPHPGLKVATDRTFDGRLRDIEFSFKEELKNFVPLVLSPENLIVKKINGSDVKARDLLNYFRAYLAVFQGDEMPEPKSMLEATSEANNLASLSEAKDHYISSMEAVCGGDKPYLSEAALEAQHGRVRDGAIEVFNGKRKMGGEEFSAKYRHQLEREIDESFENFKSHNEAKNIFKAANTPITLTAIAMVLYMLTQILGLIGLYSFANLTNLCMMFTFILLAAWSYVRYTGNMANVGSRIDQVASTIWQSGLQPAMTRLAEEGTQLAARQALQRLNSTSANQSKKKK